MPERKALLRAVARPQTMEEALERGRNVLTT